MQNKIKKYLILICAMCGIVLYDIGLSEMHEARALPTTRGMESVQVQVISSENIITLDYSIPRSTLTSLGEESSCPKGTCTKTRLRAGNASQKDREGEPVIPVIPSIVIIPAGKAIDNINVTRSGEFEHEGEYFLEFGRKARVISDTTPFEPAMPDYSIYDSDNPFPGITHELVTVQNKCGVSIAYINLYTVTYYPLSGRIVSYSSISLYVNLKEAGAQSVYDIACRPERVNPERMDIENPDALESYTPAYCQQVRDALPTGGICDPSETYEYVIITNEELKIASPPYIEHTLSELIDWREVECGLTATVVTVEEITSDDNYDYGDHNDQDPAEDDAVMIRNFIKDAYNNWETDYVLILGTIDIVPMRELSAEVPGIIPEKLVSSGLYYQCLNGPYNSGGNQNKWGEHNDGVNGSDVDLHADVYTGRAYTENIQEMSNFILKTTKYEQTVKNDDPYLNNALMLGQKEVINDEERYSSVFMDEIRNGSDKYGIKTRGFASTPDIFVQTLYDRDFEWLFFHINEMINDLNPYSIWNHLGHGNEVIVMRISNYNVQNHWNNKKFPFLYSQACNAGRPILNNYIGQELTTLTETGMWGAVLNSRYGINYFVENDPNYTDGASQRLNREFWDAYFFEGFLHVGELHVDSHEDILWDISNPNIRWVLFVNNLFGDPYTPFKDRIPCDIDLSNITLDSKKDVLARRKITASELVQPSNVNIIAPADITFASGVEIHLFDGFKVNRGAEFRAFINPTLYKSDCD